MMDLATKLIGSARAADASSSSSSAAAAVYPAPLLLPCLHKPTKCFSLPHDPLGCNIIMIGVWWSS
jgi:hypothetical protein